MHDFASASNSPAILRTVRLREHPRVTIVGCGALGLSAAELVTRAGVPQLRLIDADNVDTIELSTTSLLDENDAQTNQTKVAAATSKLRAINSRINLEPIAAHLTEQNAADLLAGSNVVLDGTGNDVTRHAINAACVALEIPWVFASRMEYWGLVMTIVPRKTPCFVCAFGLTPHPSLSTHNRGACWLITARVVASLQVQLALRLVQGAPVFPGLLYVDLRELCIEKVHLRGPPGGCPVCGYG